MTKLDDGLRNIAMDAHVLHKCFYHFGETVYLSAVPAEGYVFKQWRVEFGNVQLADATSASTTFTMPLSPVELTAVFEVIHLGTPAPSAAIASYNSIAISWQEIPGATGYEVWRALSTSGKCSKVASPVEPHWMDAGLTTGTAYYYKVRAANKAGAMPLYGDYSDRMDIRAAIGGRRDTGRGCRGVGCDGAAVLPAAGDGRSIRVYAAGSRVGGRGGRRSVRGGFGFPV
jgi:hypothetical protein